MNNFPAIIRSFIIYAACVVLAIWLGYMQASPLTYSQLTIYGLLALILFFPILLRWHYPLLLLSWHFTAVAFLLPGRPSLCLLMIVLSLGISVLQRMLSKESQFVTVPQITLPILCLIGVIAFTAKMTGVGLHLFGSDVYGGKKYIYLVGGILGYFALSAQRIPLKRKELYLGLFFLGGITGFIGDLLPIMPHSLYFIYYFFDVNQYAFTSEGFGGEAMRLHGAVMVADAVIWYMLAKYGLKGIFVIRKPLRWLTFMFFSVYGLFGGFRSFVVMLGLLFVMQFFLEGLHRTKLLPIFLVSGLMGAMALIPLASRLPYTFQRALSVLPYHVSEQARFEAQQSSEWRIQMWQAILPQIPQYLLLGKGYVISPLDYDFVMGPEASINSTFAQNQGLALAEDFHSGPLSIIIPFGIWGVIAFLWFLAAGTRVLYLNYRYGDPALQTLNTFFFANFIAQTIFFMAVFGDFSSGTLTFTSMLGLSVAFNGGVRRRVRATQPFREMEKNQRPAGLPPSSLPAFQRRG